MNNTTDLTGSHALLVQLLFDKGRLKKEELAAIQETQLKEKLPVEEILLKKRLVNEQEIAQAYAEYLLVPLFEPAENQVRVDPKLGFRDERVLPQEEQSLIATAALKWLLRNPDVHTVIPAMNELHHVDDAVAACDARLTSEERGLLDDIAAKSPPWESRAH